MLGAQRRMYNLKSPKVFIIGDSHAASLSFDLKEKLINSNYQFNTFLLGDCGFFPDLI